MVLHLIGQSQQHAEEAAQVTLTGRQLASARIVCPVQGGGTVHDQQGVPASKGEGPQHTHLSVKQHNKK